MTYSNASAPALPASRMLTAITKFIGVFAAAVALTAGSAFAQQPAAPGPAPAAKPAAPAKKPAPASPAAPAAPADPAPEAEQQAPAQAQGEQQQQAQLIYSPWTKFCLKGHNNEPNAKHVCVTVKDAPIQSCMPVVAAV